MSKYFNPVYSEILLTLLNPIFHTDSYKVSHKDMEVEGTELIYSNLTARVNKYFKRDYPEHDGKVVFFGLQNFILQELIYNWNVGFFQRDVEEVLAEIEDIFGPYIQKRGVSLNHFRELHAIGYLPLEVKALDEGSLVPIGVPLLTIKNTHKGTSWLTNYIESVLSVEIWKPITIATTAREFSKLRDKYFDLTVSDHTFKTFAIHDFSYRGHSSHSSAAICGAAALLYSSGTDNIPGLVTARKLYGAKPTVAFSVNASEHSVTTLGINWYAMQVISDPQLEVFAEQLKTVMTEQGLMEEYTQALGELATIYHLITKVYPLGILSYVADSYDFWRVLRILLPILKPVITAREGKLVIRPDSGDPVKIVCGDPEGKTEDEVKGAIQVLEDVFGSVINGKGFKELPPPIGLIYGDGITYKRAVAIYSGLQNNGFAANTVVLGVGSYSFAGGTRDSLGMAIKATAGLVYDQPVAIYKAPKTDDGTKKSAKGFLQVLKDPVKGFVLVNNVQLIDEGFGALRSVFLNSQAIYLQTFDEISELANQ